MIDDHSRHGSDGVDRRDELTGMPAYVQLSATDETPEPLGEHDQTIVNAFLDTLARVALAVAGRRTSPPADEGEQVEP